MPSSAPDPGDQPTGDDDSKRTVFTVAEMLGRRSPSALQRRVGSQPGEAHPVFAASTRHKVAVSASAFVAVGSLVATAALFGHVDRGAGAIPPGSGHPDPEQPGLDHPGLGLPRVGSGGPGVTTDLGDALELMPVELPTVSGLAAARSRSATAPRSRPVSTRASGGQPSSGGRGGSAEVVSTRSTRSSGGRAGAGLAGLVRHTGDTVGSAGRALGPVGQPVAAVGTGVHRAAPAVQRSVGQLSDTVREVSRQVRIDGGQRGRHHHAQHRTGLTGGSIGSFGL